MMPFSWSTATAEERAAYAVQRNAAERAAQGLPPQVADPSTLARIGSLFRVARRERVLQRGAAA